MLIQGDAVRIPLPDKSVHSIVTDPPYGLSFMGKNWDHGIPGIRFWKEALRVAKPGAHLLAFGGTRTFHRLAVAIEDAGWEIRDTLGWIYGQGFPKSHNVGKAIDKMAGVEREIVGEYQMPTDSDAGNAGKPTIDRGDGGAFTAGGNVNITAPATEAAKQWDGWGTALKPAVEFICMVRKPFKGTVASNVLEHDTGAINIDGCRVGTDEDCARKPSKLKKGAIGYLRDDEPLFGGRGNSQGRWPANIIHDGSDEVLDVFPQSKGQQGDLHETGRSRPSSGRFGDMAPPYAHPARNDKGSAARFFYCAKASKKERWNWCGQCNITFSSDERAEHQTTHGTWHEGVISHPTQKPIALMRYLCRLVTPPDGTVFDPFMGSGSTGVAAIQEGFEFIGCDIESEYIEIAKKRIDKVITDGIQLSLLNEPPLFNFQEK